MAKEAILKEFDGATEHGHLPRRHAKMVPLIEPHTRTCRPARELHHGDDPLVRIAIIIPDRPAGENRCNSRDGLQVARSGRQAAEPRVRR
jgi:hypothetical protein